MPYLIATLWCEYRNGICIVWVARLTSNSPRLPGKDYASIVLYSDYFRNGTARICALWVILTRSRSSKLSKMTLGMSLTQTLTNFIIGDFIRHQITEKNENTLN